MGLILENINYYDVPVFLITGFEENWEELLKFSVFQEICALLDFGKQKDRTIKLKSKCLSRTSLKYLYT